MMKDSKMSYALDHQAQDALTGALTREGCLVELLYGA